MLAVVIVPPRCWN